MSKDWRPYALHIIDCIDKIDRIRLRGDTTQDEVLYDATLRNLQTLSEATQRLPDALTAQYPDVAWQRIRGFRNILVHNHIGEIDAKTVSDVINDYLPRLRSVVSALLSAGSN